MGDGKGGREVEMPTKHLEELKMEICRESCSRGVLKDGVKKKMKEGRGEAGSAF